MNGMRRLAALILCLCLLAPFTARAMEDEDVSFQLPPSTPAPTPHTDSYPIVAEVQVNSKLLVLAYEDKPASTWDKPVFGQDGMNVPQLYQNDFQTAVCEYDGDARSVATSGCSVACLSMALYYLTGDDSQTPTTLLREACLAGYYTGNGVKQSDLEALATAHGVKAQRCAKKTSLIRRAMERGYPIVATMGDGYFGNGHYIVLRGLTKDDRLLVNDPNSPEKSARTYPLASVFYQLSGSLPLLVLMPKDGGMDE